MAATVGGKVGSKQMGGTHGLCFQHETFWGI